MRAILAGHTGLEKETFLERLSDLCRQAGRVLGIYDLEKETVKQCGSPSPSHLDQYFQNKNLFIRYRKEAFEKINKHIDDDGLPTALLNIHVTYRRRRIPFHVIDYQQLMVFRPDMFITLIDDVYRVQARIKTKAEKIADAATAEITLKDIMEWRYAEIMHVETMANFSGHIQRRSIPHYIIPLRGGERVVYQLLFESEEALGARGDWKPKAYIGFPITKTLGDSPEAKTLAKERDRFRKRMKDLDLIIFDPYGIEEKALSIALAAVKNKREAPDTVHVISEDEEVFQVNKEEAEEVDFDIGVQVPARDYMMIYQSDFFVGYRPALSSGEKSEIANANQLGKPVYVVWPKSDPPKDDFEELKVTEQYETIEELIEAIRRKVIPYFRGRR